MLSKPKNQASRLCWKTHRPIHKHTPTFTDKKGNMLILRVCGFEATPMGPELFLICQQY